MERWVEVVLTLGAAGLVGWALGLTMLRVNDKAELRPGDEPLRFTGWRPR